MNKKILIIIPVVILLIIIISIAMFFGIRKSTNSNESEKGTINNEESADNNNVSNLEYVEQYEYWGMKEMEKPSIPGLIWEEKKVVENTNVNIAKTAFDINVDKVYENLKENQYIKENYGDLVRSAQEKGKGEYYEDAKYQIAYEFDDVISAKIKDKKASSLKLSNDFTITYRQDTANYSNYNYIQLMIFGLEWNETIQDDLLSVVKPIFGDYAEYLIYAKDSDGKEYNGKTLNGYREVGMSELIDNGDSSYYISREIDRTIGDGDFSIRLQIGVAENTKENVFFYHYGLDNESMYSKMKYTYEDLLPTTFGSKNPLEFKTFANNYYSSAFSNYINTSLDYWDFEIYENENNEMQYYMELSTKGNMSGLSKVLSPKLKYEISISEKDNKITDMEIYIEGASLYNDSENKENNYLLQIKTIKSLVSNIIPDVNISDIVYQTNVEKYKKDISCKFLEQSLNGTFELELGNKFGTYKIKLAIDENQIQESGLKIQVFEGEKLVGKESIENSNTSDIEQKNEEEIIDSTKTHFNVFLKETGNQNVEVMQVLKNELGLSLSEAKELTKKTPIMIKENMPRQEAIELKSKLVEVGATVGLE